MRYLLLLLYILLLLSTTPTQALVDCSVKDDPDLSSAMVLSANDSYQLQYKVVDGTNLTIVLSIPKASQAGFLAFGIPEQTSGFMTGTDVVTARLGQDGALLVEDRFVPWTPFPYAPYEGIFIDGIKRNVSTGTIQLFPKRDCENGGTDDWVGLSAHTDETCIQITLTRLFETGDTNDRAITTGRMRISWAIGPSDNSVTYHGTRRGTTAAYLRSSSPPAPTPCPTCVVADFEFASDYVMPAQDTTYVQQLFRFNDSVPPMNDPNQIVHIVGFEPLVDPDLIPYVHHMVVFACSSLNAMQPNSEPSLDQFPNCNDVLWAWGIGGGSFFLPPEVGFNVSLTPAESTYHSMYLQLHLTNFGHISGINVVNTGVRIHFDTTPRPNVGMGIFLGVFTLTMPDIPPHTTRIHRQSTCPTLCTQGLAAPLTVFASFLHMHRLGKSIWTSIYDKNGTFRGTTNRIDNWNHGFQETYATPGLIINPGDRLQTHCVFDSTKWPTPTIFNEGSDEEMCLNLIFIYPALPGGGPGCGANYQNNKNGPKYTQCGPAMITDESLQIEDPVTLPGANLNETIMFSKPGSICPLPPAVNKTADVGYDFTITVAGMDFSWTKLHPHSGLGNNTKLKLHRNGLGWIGFGLPDPDLTSGNRMIGANVVIAFPNGTCELFSVSDTSLAGFTPITDDSEQQQQEFNCTVTMDDGTITLEFVGVSVGSRRFHPLVAPPPPQGGRLLEDDTATTTLTNFIVAQGSTTFGQHDLQTSFSVDLSANSSGTVAVDSAAQRWRAAHAFLMTFAFTVLLPVGVMMPAYFKPRQTPDSSFDWFIAHKTLMGSAIIVAWSGFGVIAYSMDASGSKHFSQTHHIVGLTALILLSFQPINAVLRPHAPHAPGEVKTSARKWWERLHHFLGRSAIALSAVNIVLGVYYHSGLLADYNWVAALFYSVDGVFVLAFGGTYLLVKVVLNGRRRQVQEQKVGGGLVSANPKFV